MKHTKRFLVAIALLLATLLISGLALAEEAKTEETKVTDLKLTFTKTEFEVPYGGMGILPYEFDPEEGFKIEKTVTPEGAEVDVVLVSSDTEVARAYGSAVLLAKNPNFLTVITSQR